MALTIGEPAPDFDLTATIGGRVRLSDHRGSKVVVVFYPFAFSGICTGELCQTRDITSDLAALDAVVLGVSCDPLESLWAFAGRESLSFPLLSDFWPHGEVAKEYGVFVDKIGAADRGTFIIDRQGAVAGAIVTELGRPRDPQAYREVLAGID